jgi:adenylate kinase
MGRVIYVTGAPATGKSTLCAGLIAARADIQVFSYSLRLRDLVHQQDGIRLSSEGIRKQSAGVITKAHIEQLDRDLIEFVKRERDRCNLVIDSHPVTKEAYGFRITAFSHLQISELAPDAIVCLFAAPEVIAARIAAAPEGRQPVSTHDLAMHSNLQAAVAAQYGVITGKAVYFLDSAISQDELLARALKAAKFDSSP